MKVLPPVVQHVASLSSLELKAASRAGRRMRSTQRIVAHWPTLTTEELRT